MKNKLSDNEALNNNVIKIISSRKNIEHKSSTIENNNNKVLIKNIFVDKEKDNEFEFDIRYDKNTKMLYIENSAKKIDIETFYKKTLSENYIKQGLIIENELRNIFSKWKFAKSFTMNLRKKPHIKESQKTMLSNKGVVRVPFSIMDSFNAGEIVINKPFYKIKNNRAMVKCKPKFIYRDEQIHGFCEIGIKILDTSIIFDSDPFGNRSGYDNTVNYFYKRLEKSKNSLEYVLDKMMRTDIERYLKEPKVWSIKDHDELMDLGLILEMHRY